MSAPDGKRSPELTELVPAFITDDEFQFLNDYSDITGTSPGSIVSSMVRGCLLELRLSLERSKAGQVTSRVNVANAATRVRLSSLLPGSGGTGNFGAG